MYSKVFGLKRRSSACEMFVLNNISNFEALMRSQSLPLQILKTLLFAQSRDLGLLELRTQKFIQHKTQRLSTNTS